MPPVVTTAVVAAVAIETITTIADAVAAGVTVVGETAVEMLFAINSNKHDSQMICQVAVKKSKTMAMMVK